MRRALLALGVVLGACRPVMAPKVPAPRADPSDRWERRLGEVVTDGGYVDYASLQADRQALDEFVAWIAKPRRVPRSVTQHAFWLNAYNALVLYAVLEDGVPASVMDVDGWLPKPGSGFFFERAFLVQGQPTSLHEIEHERLRGRVMDMRDHAALNCASMSCPPLRPELYDNDLVEQQLRDQMRVWLSDPRRGVEVVGDEAVLSPLFDWYAFDFAFMTAGRDPCHIAARSTTGALSRQLDRLSEQGCPHRFRDWDWSLNDAARAPAAEGGGERPRPIRQKGARTAGPSDKDPDDSPNDTDP